MSSYVSEAISVHSSMKPDLLSRLQPVEQPLDPDILLILACEETGSRGGFPNCR